MKTNLIKMYYLLDYVRQIYMNECMKPFAFSVSAHVMAGQLISVGINVTGSGRAGRPVKMCSVKYTINKNAWGLPS